MTSQYSEIPSGLDGNFCVNNVHYLKRRKELLGLVEIPIILKTLENFCQDKVAYQKGLAPKQAIQQLSL